MTEEKISNDILDITWKTYFKSKKDNNPDLECQRKLVEHYYPIVKKVANRLHQKLAEVQQDELTSMGIDGLYDAISGFDPDRATKFETYAMHRIRGSMLDAIRKSDWVPRLVRSNSNKLDKFRQVVESDAGRRLSASELAERIGMTEHEFDNFYKSSVTTTVHSVNDTSWNSNNEKMSIVDVIKDNGADQPIHGLFRKEIFAKLLGSNCSEQERKIVKLYYYDNFSMKEISDILGLSESRVSQMHSMILKRLKQKVKRNPEFFSDIFGFVEKMAI